MYKRRRNGKLFHSKLFLDDDLTDSKSVDRSNNFALVYKYLQAEENFFHRMHKNTKFALSGVVIIVSFAIIILILHLNNIESNPVRGTCVNLDGGQRCYAKDQNPYRNYGSKTAYHVTLEDNNDEINTEGCEPKLFYMLSRHATRYPDKEYINYINDYLPDLKEEILRIYADDKANLCKDDINKLKSWEPTMNSTDENRLSATGRIETEELGKRLRKRFNSLLGMQYSPDRFIIEYTSRERTRHTAENFARGLFTEQDYEMIDFNGNKNDKVLQFHKDCKNLRRKCENPNYDLKEVEKFKNGTLMMKVISSVSKRIGYKVSYDDVVHMYVACTFGYALNISDAWCAVFSNDDLKVLEYMSDIEDYYKSAYGNKINYQQACPVVKYIYDLFKSYENSKKSKIVLHFSHAGAMKKVYAALGLFRDDRPLTSEDFCALNNRKWRTSLIVPFNSNIVFVLYDCNGELKFISLHNEKPVIIEGCDSKLCPLRKFYDKYMSAAESCDLKEICDICKTK